MIRFPQPDIEQYFQTYVIRHFAVSDDESRIVFNSNLNGQPNVWAMDLSQGYPYPLTFLNQSSDFLKIDPKGRYILAGFDRDGDEKYHIHALKPEGGVPLKLIEGDTKDRYYFAHLSKDGERIYYCTTAGNPNYLNTRVRHIASGEDELLQSGDGKLTMLAAVSPDEKTLIYSRIYANTYQTSYAVIEGETMELSPDPDQPQVMGDFIFTDPDTVVFITDYEDEHAYIAEFKLSSRVFRKLHVIEGEGISNIAWSKNDHKLYIWTDLGIENRMYMLDPASGERQAVALPTDVVEQAVVKESGNVYILGRGAVQPHNIYRLQDGVWQAMTKNVVTGLDEASLSYPEVVHYNSFDGLEIEALLFRAKPEQANGYTIFWPHGGPQASEGKFFRPMFQFLLAYGYHIFAPNFRGSTGYGSAFVKMVEGDWGEGPRLDCVAGLDWLFEQGISSPDRLFIVGGSYGGYMTLLLAGRHPDYFRAAVDIFGPSNLFTFLESVPEDWKPIMEQWLGDPVKDRERLTKDSPITYLDQMVKPMLVIQGANDPRVVQAESDQMVAALQEKGTEVEYLLLPDEGHGFSRRANEVLVYKRMLEFLKKHQETPVTQA
ncbi:alpha/beta fold hydrolase [Paenibacillus sp. JX-17]|uniref:Alpha/beta fold hydrolase n=1 Tax=Paenibacillus lacisoli TaxID=3064525 RepID=A0ABT9CBU6_9BACL|nr:alpha/beta fold hydrolase [Paenibacillus sp. JX-17]MDO7906712.1 alpha/beta fold hydrolase [Paenibacillus sp. JX-17]